jgi:hypothetical protein
MNKESQGEKKVHISNLDEFFAKKDPFLQVLLMSSLTLCLCSFARLSALWILQETHGE